MGTDPTTQRSRFRRTRFRAGYSPEEVDAFVAKVEEALHATTPRITGADIREHRFTPVRLMSGYDPDDVDDYLAEAYRELDRRRDNL